MTTIRDPLWNNIRVEGPYLALLDSPAFQRLRYVRQLGLAHLVYPGATHSRFEHALGAYHLARLTLRVLDDAGQLAEVNETARELVAAAALLHDIGHYPFSHALEEIGVPHHEEVAGPLITEGPVGEILRTSFGVDAPARVLELIRGTSGSPLQGLISGSIDLDKTDYLKRDALMCGVAYGEIDVDRLRHALVLLRDPSTGRLGVGLREKGLSALESLLFAKYQMYRNVYWQHAVRSATAMYKRLVEDALQSGALQVDALAGYTDEGILHALERRDPPPLVAAIRERRLYKRAAEAPAAELAARTDLDLEWIAEDRTRTRAAEDTLAKRHGLKSGELLLDYPRKERMIGLDLPLLTRDGAVRHLNDKGLAGAINLPILAEQLYQSARWLRVFVKGEGRLEMTGVLEVLGSA
ncbi:MAG: HD domain-containing protein [Gemmatimonadaceae bacterium]